LNQCLSLIPHLTRFAQVLNLASCGIGSDGATSLCGVLHSLRFMKSLLLSRNAIASDALSTLARTLSSRRSLELLDLSSTNAGDAGAHALLPLLQSAGCPKELRLKDNAIKSAGALRLLDAATSSHSMQVLDLSNNSIDDSVNVVQCILRHRSHHPADCLCSGRSVLCCIRHQAHPGWQLLGQQNSSRRCRRAVLRLRGCRVMHIAIEKIAGAARNIGCECAQTINSLSVNSLCRFINTKSIGNERFQLGNGFLAASNPYATK
jgi:Ran GTPase-activating protein (RanGAP) involved in mRNA processing and transport